MAFHENTGRHAAVNHPSKQSKVITDDDPKRNQDSDVNDSIPAAFVGKSRVRQEMKQGLFGGQGLFDRQSLFGCHAAKSVECKKNI